MTDKMTNQEAIDRLKLIRSPYMEVAIDMAIGALQAEPVKHGEWEVYEMHTTQYGKVGFQCSACGVPYKLEHRLGADVGWHYCPNCGAKMDGGKDER